MDKQLLKAFIVVAQHRSFSQAGEELCISQSAVSKRIHQLELYLDIPLFERHNRSVSLTEAGELLLPKARRILEMIQDTEQEITNAQRQISGTLNIATSHHIGIHRLPPFLREFVRRYPDVTLKLEFMGSERAYDAVRTRQVELALTTLDPEQTGEFSSDVIWQDELVCVCGTEHQLTRNQPLTLQQLAMTPVILPDANTITHQLVDAVFHKHGLKLYSPIPTNYLETIKMMVSVGLGWSMLPASMVDDSVTSLAWPETGLIRSLGVVRLAERPESNASRALLELINSPAFR